MAVGIAKRRLVLSAAVAGIGCLFPRHAVAVGSTTGGADLGQVWDTGSRAAPNLQITDFTPASSNGFVWPAKIELITPMVSPFKERDAATENAAGDGIDLE